MYCPIYCHSYIFQNITNKYYMMDSVLCMVPCAEDTRKGHFLYNKERDQVLDTWSYPPLFWIYALF